MTLPYYLFLDDVRKPSDVTWIDLPLVPWTIVRNYSQFTQAIRDNGLPLAIAYDHDLADEHYASAFGDERSSINYNAYTEKTGYDAAKFVANYCISRNLKIPTYYIHTLNPIGAGNIKCILDSAARAMSI